MEELYSLRNKLNATDKELTEALEILIDDVRGNSKKVSYKELLGILEQSVITIRRC